MESANTQREAIVAGWTAPRGSRPFFETLLLAERGADNRLRYIGQVRAGFSDADLGRIWTRLHALRTRRPAFSSPAINGAHWVKPGLEIVVSSKGWTKQGMLRHPSFAGLSEERRESSHAHVTDRAARTTRHD